MNNFRRQWLRLSCWNGHFQFQRSAVQIHSLAKIYIEHLLSTVLKRRKLRRKKGPVMTDFYKIQ